MTITSILDTSLLGELSSYDHVCLYTWNSLKVTILRTVHFRRTIKLWSMITQVVRVIVCSWKIQGSNVSCYKFTSFFISENELIWYGFLLIENNPTSMWTSRAVMSSQLRDHHIFFLSGQHAFGRTAGEELYVCTFKIDI